MSMLLATRVWPLKLDKTTAFVLMALCDIADDDGTECYPSPKYLAWKTGVSLRTAYRVLEKLEDARALEFVGQRDGKIGYNIHLEVLPLKAPWERPRRGRPSGAKSRATVANVGHHDTTLGDKSCHHDNKSCHHDNKDCHGDNKSCQGDKIEGPSEGPQSRISTGLTAPRRVSYPDLVEPSLQNHLDDPPRETPAFFAMGSAWNQVVHALSISPERQDKLLRRCRLERHVEDKRVYRLVCADTAAQDFAAGMRDAMLHMLRSLPTTARDATLEVTR